MSDLPVLSPRGEIVKRINANAEKRERSAKVSAARRLLDSADEATAAGVARMILDPLCEDTGKLLDPVKLSPNDRLKITLDEEGTHFIVQAYALLNGQKVQASWNAYYKWIDNVPEKKDLGANRWLLAATDVTALIINASWHEDRIDMEEEVRLVYRFLLVRFLSQTIIAQQRAIFKLRCSCGHLKSEHGALGQCTCKTMPRTNNPNALVHPSNLVACDCREFTGQLPPLPDDWHDHPNKPLLPYQVVACVGMLGQQGANLHMEQGTGKTAPSIRRICIEAHRHYLKESVAAKAEGRKRQLYKVIIACPKNVRHNWQNEIHDFATVPGKVTVLSGGVSERTTQIFEAVMSDEDSEFTVVISSYEGIDRTWNVLRMLPWQLAIADEAHYMKNPYAQRPKRMMELRNICDATLGLTGTPVTNSVTDLYTQLEFIGEGMSGFMNWRNFKKFYGQYIREGQGQNTHDRLVKYQNLPLLQERLARTSFMITKKEALPFLPDKTYDVITVSMTKNQRESYVKLQQQLALEIEDGTIEGKRLTAQHILTKLLRLAQITSGFVKWDAKYDMEGNEIETGQIEFFNPNPKLDEFINQVKEMPEDEKMIAWATFVPDILEISKRLTAEGIKHGTYYGGTNDEDRVALETGFNQLHARDMKVFVGNAAAGGTGLNLRGYDPDAERNGREDHGCNCTRVIYYSQDWSMMKRAQSEDRSHRRGTRVSIRYTDLVVPGTIDEEIRARVVLKKMNALSIQDIREILTRLLDTSPADEDE